MTIFSSIPKPSYTPWGVPTFANEVAAGIWWVGTPSHGGIIVSEQRRQHMPVALQLARTYGNSHSFEEDCEYALVVCSFPEEFAPDTVQTARATIRGTAAMLTARPRPAGKGGNAGLWRAAADYASRVEHPSEIAAHIVP